VLCEQLPYFDSDDPFGLSLAQDLHISFVGFFALGIWYSGPTPKQVIQVGLLHSVQMPPPSVSNFAPQT
jgi:hypothetical protein